MSAVPSAEPLLSARGLSVGYAGQRVVRGLELDVRPGEITVLLGANGVGKTTTLLTMAGVIPPVDGEVLVDGRPVRGPLHRRARLGLSFVSEERSVFAGLTVRQNLRLAGCDVGRVTALFPELEPMLGRRAGLLSGGEQQMLTLGRALTRPGVRVLVADELSLGLAPKAVDRLLRAVREAADGGLAVLLVEQHVARVLDVADVACVLARGEVRLRASAAEAREQIDEIRAHYLGGPSETTSPSDPGAA